MKSTILSFLFVITSSLVFGQTQTHSSVALMQLRNCSKEMRVMSYIPTLNFFDRWIRGLSRLEQQKVLFFSKDYVVDSSYLRDGVRNIRATLPNNFWEDRQGEKWYDNEPNEEGIWFIKLFVQVDKSGQRKILSAYKITFEGTDAKIDSQRRDPKIKSIEFILDKDKLSKLNATLKKATEAF